MYRPTESFEEEYPPALTFCRMSFESFYNQRHEINRIVWLTLVVLDFFIGFLTVFVWNKGDLTSSEKCALVKLERGFLACIVLTVMSLFFKLTDQKKQRRSWDVLETYQHGMHKGGSLFVRRPCVYPSCRRFCHFGDSK